ncbi:hypothetical protein [Anaerovirgula multivorans]|uniref:hypothetical protein n=1 Tax=Anaerovirgula multivorans TaxID=312168 RepID=UPI000B77BF7C|nr:hypothetical protein [Anaerovirgula multivorans]
MKYRNYGLWVSIFSLVGLLLGNYGLYETIGLDTESYQTIVDALLATLAMAGVISNPEKGDWYKDSK